MQRYLSALPPWLGSKKAIARDIMRVIADEDCPPGSTLADAFFGGGGVSMAAKALGYRVHGNDMSPTSVAIGKALIENRRRQLNALEIQTALTFERAKGELPPPKELSLPDNCRRVLSSMVGAERATQADLPARELLRAWIAKTALTMATWGVPTMAAGRRTWDELTPGQAQQLTRTGRPLQLARRLAGALNRGVFDNGEANTMQRGDAVEFAGAVDADVIYLDPPYPGTLSYEEVYVGVNRLLEPGASGEASEWSAADGWLLLEQVFDAAEAVPLWVVSMGKGADPDRIAQMMSERGHKPTVRSLAHRHLPALKKATDAEGDELLIVGKKGAGG